MEKDTYKTKVIFRKFAEGDILAIFPEESNKINYKTSCYQHIGQHSDCDYNHCINITKLATPEEYKDLFNELESIGYNLEVRKKAKIKYL